jgi:hypothetical protein
MRQAWRRRGWVGLLVFALAACQAAPLQIPTATARPAQPPPSATPVVTATAPPTLPASLTATASVTAPRQPTSLPPAERPAYALTATVDLIAHTVSVSASVSFLPPDPRRAVFNFNPLQSARLAAPLLATVNGQPISPTVEGVWVTVPLPPGLPSASPVTIAFTYHLSLAGIDPGAWGWRGTLGWTSRQLNLGDWYPVLAPYVDDAWLAPSPSALGEYVTTPFSDYAVRLAVDGAGPAVFVAGSGTPTACAPAWCYTLVGGRFVAYVVSAAMQTATLRTAGGVTVTSVYLPEHAAAGSAALNTAAAALDTFSALYGPYPYTHYVQVEGDFYDGMEYSGLSFVGGSDYAGYDFTPRNLLTLISAHEVAHQWWHTLVGNDQAAEPWLDEALATYSESLFLQRNYPDALDWWWAFRIDWFAPQGAVNSTVYTYDTFRGYVDAVYLRGAQMLRAMHTALGDDRFLAFLRTYAAQRAGTIATAPDFWAAYRSAGGDPAAIQAVYFQP